MHGEDDLELPGGGGQMNNFRRNPMVDSPWAGGMHRVLIEHGILRKLQVNQTSSTPPQILIEGQGHAQNVPCYLKDPTPQNPCIRHRLAHPDSFCFRPRFHCMGEAVRLFLVNS